MKSRMLVLIACLIFFSACAPNSTQPVQQKTTASVSRPIAVTPAKLVPSFTPVSKPAPIQTATQSESQKPKDGMTLQAISSEGSINVRSGPGIYYPVVGQVKNNAAILATGIDESKQWIQFINSQTDGGFAWIYVPFTTYNRDSQSLATIKDLPPTPEIPTVKPPKAVATIKVVYPDGLVNVRFGPGTIYPIVGKVVDGETLSVIGIAESGDWIQFLYSEIPGGVAWISAPFTSYDRNALSLPVLNEQP